MLRTIRPFSSTSPHGTRANGAKLGAASRGNPEQGDKKILKAYIDNLASRSSRSWMSLFLIIISSEITFFMF